MKILIYSDLHLEFDSFTPKKEWLEKADLVVQVGDLQYAPNNIKILKSWNVPILFIPGNHDFWNPIYESKSMYGFGFAKIKLRYERHVKMAIQQMKEAADGSKVKVLYNDSVEIDGVKFIGTTLWYNAKALTEGEVLNINDYKRIFRAEDKLIDTEFVQEEHNAAVKYIDTELGTPFDGKRVLLTHHPAWITPKIAEMGFCSKVYGTNLNDLWKDRADIMVHGHTHEHIDTKIGNTRIICNCRGYPHQHQLRSKFNKQLIVEI